METANSTKTRALRFVVSGPGMIRDENGRLSGYVYVDVTGRDIGGYVRDAKKAVFEKIKIPPGYQLVWSGQYEYMERVKERLNLVVPITLFIVFLLLYFNTRSTVKTFIILLAVPFSAVAAPPLSNLIATLRLNFRFADDSPRVRR